MLVQIRLQFSTGGDELQFVEAAETADRYTIGVTHIYTMGTHIYIYIRTHSISLISIVHMIGRVDHA